MYSQHFFHFFLSQQYASESHPFTMCSCNTFAFSPAHISVYVYTAMYYPFASFYFCQWQQGCYEYSCACFLGSACSGICGMCLVVGVLGLGLCTPLWYTRMMIFFKAKGPVHTPSSSVRKLVVPYPL